MANNRIRLEWEYPSLLGHGFKVYRSESPIHENNLPAPLATVPLAQKYYEDEDIELDKVYYYRVGSYLGSLVKLGEGVKVVSSEEELDPLFDKVVALLHLDDDIVDITGKTWATQNTSFTAGVYDKGLSFTRTSSRARLSCTHADLVMGEEDFAYEFYVKMDNSYDSSLLDCRLSQTSSTYELLIESDKGNIYVWALGGYLIGPFSGIIGNNTEHFIQLIRDSGTLYLAVDGAVLGSAVHAGNLASNRIWFGSSVNVGAASSSYDLQGVIDEIRITKGATRPVTLPELPFPNE